MSNLIPREFINDLLARIDIVDIIGSRIRLRKGGNNFVAPCPFHNEKTPSFTVSSTKQFYYCFGCKAHGTAIDFLMKFENLQFPEAIEALANRAGVTIPKTVLQRNETQEFKALYAIMEGVNDFYQHQLSTSNKAKSYLKSRGLTPDICQYFGLGYATDSGNNLATCTSCVADTEKLLATGMLLKKDNAVFARFRDRLMFPIRDRRGRIVGFGGRILGSSSDQHFKQAKYLNSPETPLFHKGNELYGLYEARKANNTLKFLLVVEGYMDVVALVQHGITNAVATLGTAITVKQIQQMLNYTSEIVFCFDGDNAGRMAAWRALENILPLMRDGIMVRFLFLPDQEDPDSFIRKEGRDAFARRISQCMSLEDLFFATLKKEIDLSSGDGRAFLAQKAKHYFRQMPNGVFKQFLLERLAALIRIDIDILRDDEAHDSEDSSYKGKVMVPASATQKSISIITGKLSQAEIAISILLRCPEAAKEVSNIDKIASLPGSDIELFIQLIKLIKNQPNITISAILDCYRDTEFAEILANLAVWDLIIPQNGLKEEFNGIVEVLCKKLLEKEIQVLLQKSASFGLSTEEKYQLQKLIKEKHI